MPPPRLPLSYLLSRFRIIESRSRIAPVSLPARIPVRIPRPRLSWFRTTEPDPKYPGYERRTVFGILTLGAGVFFYWHLFTTYFYDLRRCSGVSMLPTIPHWYPNSPQPWLLTSKLHRRGRYIKVGDIVTYTNPLIPNSQGCKRVIGMPGDYVCVLSPAKEDSDLDDEEFVGGRVGEEMFRVPEGHCWLVGDNLQWSRDSRVYGPVPLALVKGRVLGYVVPFREVKWFGDALEEVGEGDLAVVTKKG